jgi:hypothetical protein
MKSCCIRSRRLRSVESRAIAEMPTIRPSVLVQSNRIERRHQFALQQPRENRRPFLGPIRWKDQGDVAAHHLLGRVAVQLLRPGIPGGDDSLRGRAGDRVARAGDQCRQPRRVRFGPFAVGDVVKQDRYFPAARAAEPEDVGLEPPPVQRRRLHRHPRRRARSRHRAVDLVPERLVLRNQVAHRFPGRPGQSGLLFEGAVRLQEAVVDHRPVAVEIELDHAEPRVERGEEGAVPFLAPAQRLLGPDPLGHVGEVDSDLPALRSADAEGEDVEPPAVHRRCLVHESDGLTGPRNATVRLEPEGIEVGHQLASGLPDRLMQPGQLLERGVRLQKAVVDRSVLVVEQHLDDAEAGIERGEEGAEASLALGNLVAGASLLLGVGRQPGMLPPQIVAFALDRGEPPAHHGQLGLALSLPRLQLHVLAARDRSPPCRIGPCRARRVSASLIPAATPRRRARPLGNLAAHRLDRTPHG